MTVKTCRPAAAVLAFAMLALAQGCSGDPPTGTIVGNVTYQGRPIPGGTIAFMSSRGKVASATIASGAYKIAKVEVGPGAAVAISSHPPSPMMHPPTGFKGETPIYKPEHYVAIPERYGDPGASGLTYDVVEGDQTKDFQLAK